MKPTTIPIDPESITKLRDIQSIKQLATGKKVSKISEIIDDLMELKNHLPYYSQGLRRIGGILSHSKESEKKRQRTVNTKKSKTKKPKSREKKK